MKITNDSSSIIQDDTENSNHVPVVRNDQNHQTMGKNLPNSSNIVAVPTSNNSQQLAGAINQQPKNLYSMVTQSSTSNQQSTSSANQNHGAMPKGRTTAVTSFRMHWDDQIRRIIENHNKGSRILIIMRGAPGCGKTHMAKTIIDMLVCNNYMNYNTHIFSTDDYFMHNGKYYFNKHNLSQAHAWNQHRVKVAMFQGFSPIIIDNTNIDLWEMEFYVMHGVNNGYFLEVVEPNTAWARNASQLAKRNVHNVPFTTIRRMLDNYVPNITGESLLEYFKLQYPHDRTPPVLRSLPVFNSSDLERISVSNTESNFVTTTSSSIIITEITDVADQPLIMADSTNNTNDCASHVEQEMSSSFLLSSLNAANSVMESVEDAGETQDTVEEVLDGNKKEDHADENKANQYLEVEQKLKEFEKFEQDWENGESWEESSKAVANNSSAENDKHVPKPQRSFSPVPQPTAADKLINAVTKCQDWNQISLFMPPWKVETTQSSNHIPVETTVETTSSGTCMELGDFDVNKNTHKIVTSTPRNINEFHISFQREKIPEKRMLDKSTTTNELMLTEIYNKRCKNEESHFKALKRFFKTVSTCALRDVFDKCMGDVNWAVEIVLDGVASNQFELVDEADVSDDEEEDNNEQCTCLSFYDIVPNSSPKTVVVSQQENTVVQNTDSTLMVVKKTSKKEITPSEASIQLKRHIEQNVVISDDHYPPHSLKFRKWRHGEDLHKEVDVNQPSTSHGAQSSNDLVVYRNESDDDSSDDETSSESMDEPEKTVNVNLGKEFVGELDALFGRSDMSYPNSLMPKVNMPISLLNQINALWMESLMHQFDERERQNVKMIQEDEEFARLVSISFIVSLLVAICGCTKNPPILRNSSGTILGRIFLALNSYL